jgi:hypothetical protein
MLRTCDCLNGAVEGDFHFSPCEEKLPVRFKQPMVKNSVNQTGPDLTNDSPFKKRSTPVI